VLILQHSLQQEMLYLHILKLTIRSWFRTNTERREQNVPQQWHSAV